ncbi:hypothetical protein AB0B54_31930, partial [Microbispora bryophytorum]|uniref:hypothetical protein n=1 Tax=Microbispora bryophytorum TaxID=1460882 RepID=UPI0034081E13
MGRGIVAVCAPGRCGVVALGRRKVKVGAPGGGVRGCPGIGIGCRTGCRIGIGCRSGCCLGFGGAGVTWPVGALTLSRCGSVDYAHVAGVRVAEAVGLIVAEVAGGLVGGDGVFDV